MTARETGSARKLVSPRRSSRSRSPRASRRSAPSQVLPGLIDGRELVRPKAFPAKYAPMSASQTTSRSDSTNATPARAGRDERMPAGDEHDDAGEQQEHAATRPARRAGLRSSANGPASTQKIAAIWKAAAFRRQRRGSVLSDQQPARRRARRRPARRRRRLSSRAHSHAANTTTKRDQRRRTRPTGANNVTGRSTASRTIAVMTRVFSMKACRPSAIAARVERSVRPKRRSRSRVGAIARPSASASKSGQRCR